MMIPMKFQLVLQWPASSYAGYERLMQIEERLINGLGEQHEVDGHDQGSGETNIFIRTNDPRAAFSRTREILNEDDFTNMRAAYREVSQNDYTILWPKGLIKFAVA